jgi:hypothetical protein
MARRSAQSGAANLHSSPTVTPAASSVASAVGLSLGGLSASAESMSSQAPGRCSRREVTEPVDSLANLSRNGLSITCLTRAGPLFGSFPTAMCQSQYHLQKPDPLIQFPRAS